MGEQPRRVSLSRRLLSSYALIFLGVIGFFGILIESAARDVLVDELAGQLADYGRVVASSEDPATELGRVAAVAQAEVTLIDGNGVAVAGSATVPAGSLLDRPEVAAALDGRVGRSQRTDSDGGERLFVAVGVPGGGAVEVSVGESRIADDLSAIRGRVAVAALIAGAIGLGFVWASARRLARPLEILTSTAAALAAGDLAERPRPSAITEIDRLGVAVDRLAADLGRRVEESTRERDTLELVLAALPQGVLLVEANDAVPYANPAAVGLLGVVDGRLGGLAPHVLQRIVRAARSGAVDASVGFEHGSPPRSLRAVATALTGGERVVVVIVDLTERQRLDAVRRDFVSDASHELKTPVAAIIAASESLRLALGRDPDRVEAFAARVEDSARQLGRIVADLLDLSRLEASNMAVESLRLDELVAGEISRLEDRAEAAGIDLVARLAPVSVTGSAPDLGLALRNLCDNALRYTDAGGTVIVTVAREGSQAIVEVADTGTGIPSRALPRLFERFYRVDVARSRATGGTGLGLAIVKHVAERHGGIVTVESELGVGSAFRLLLPAN